MVAKYFYFCEYSRGKHKNSNDVDGNDELCAENYNGCVVPSERCPRSMVNDK